MNKHTPGPWIIETGADKRGPFCTISTQTDNPILYIIPLSAEGRVEFDAYVRLIAAAPDMLETLKAFAYDYSPRPQDLSKYREQARAAIAKAESED